MSNQNYKDGQILCSALCPVEHLKPDANISPPGGSWPDIRGLHSLNYSRTTWLAGDAIEVSLTTYKRGLPQRLIDKIDIVIPGVDPRVWHSGDNGRKALARAIERPARRALNRMKKTEYSILPISSNSNHWVVVVIHKVPRQGTAEGAMEYSDVAQIAVLDSFSEQSTASSRMVHHQMKEWLERAGGFKFSQGAERTVWVPRQLDVNSCGPRAYWNGKQIMDRLLELHESGTGYDESLWRPLSGWFDEHFVRGEMIGRCAWDAVRAMEYNARVAVECVNRVTDPEKRRVQWKNAGEVMKPAGDGSATPQKRPEWTMRQEDGGRRQILSQPAPDRPQRPVEATEMGPSTQSGPVVIDLTVGSDKSTASRGVVPILESNQPRDARYGLEHITENRDMPSTQRNIEQPRTPRPTQIQVAPGTPRNAGRDHRRMNTTNDPNTTTPMRGIGQQPVPKLPQDQQTPVVPRTMRQNLPYTPENRNMTAPTVNIVQTPISGPIPYQAGSSIPRNMRPDQRFTYTMDNRDAGSPVIRTNPGVAAGANRGYNDGNVVYTDQYGNRYMGAYGAGDLGPWWTNQTMRAQAAMAPTTPGQPAPRRGGLLTPYQTPNHYPYNNPSPGYIPNPQPPTYNTATPPDSTKRRRRDGAEPNDTELPGPKRRRGGGRG
ncbi:hypothetical protein F4861DRAFT_549830 [Xylaria intraflava]|nr:hypothetical protein F4861DRAFT_549830 [Xylaria intraflava]